MTQFAIAETQTKKVSRPFSSPAFLDKNRAHINKLHNRDLNPSFFSDQVKNVESEYSIQETVFKIGQVEKP